MIKHEKIAARVRTLIPNTTQGHKAEYRLSKPIPYGTGIEKVWFVLLDTPPQFYRKLNVWAKDGETEFLLAEMLWPTTHAEALDALGYELIEEEK